MGKGTRASWLVMLAGKLCDSHANSKMFKISSELFRLQGIYKHIKAINHNTWPILKSVWLTTHWLGFKSVSTM
jgi:hypothetical protein